MGKGGIRMNYKDMKTKTLDNIQNLIQRLADELEKMTRNIAALRRASFRAYYIVCPELMPVKESE